MIELIQIFFLLIHIAFVVLLFFMTLAFASAGPFVPSNKKAIDAMIRLSGIRKGMTVIDLGSGDGRILRGAASIGANAIGYEINPFLVLWTNIWAVFSPYRSMIHAKWKSLWKADLKPAHVVFIYLLPNKLTKLEKKIRSECNPGTVVISNSFIFKDWKIEKQDTDNHIYCYIVPKQHKT